MSDDRRSRFYCTVGAEDGKTGVILDNDILLMLTMLIVVLVFLPRSVLAYCRLLTLKSNSQD